MITGWAVLNTRFIPASTSLPSSANSGPRWSMVGWSMARSTRSGTLVGPGICRKWRPVCKVAPGRIPLSRVSVRRFIDSTPRLELDHDAAQRHLADVLHGVDHRRAEVRALGHRFHEQLG